MYSLDMVQKSDVRDIVKRLHEEANNKKNITFRIDPVLAKDFQDACRDEGVKLGRVIEELMRLFVASVKKR